MSRYHDPPWHTQGKCDGWPDDCPDTFPDGTPPTARYAFEWRTTHRQDSTWRVLALCGRGYQEFRQTMVDAQTRKLRSHP